MSPGLTAALPADYPRRIRNVREILGLTQTKFAARVGVSFVSVNRWENGQSRPANLAWRRILELEATLHDHESADRQTRVSSGSGMETPPGLDFSADPKAVVAVMQAHCLAFGHLFNPAFASETSLIHPLPHQWTAVYDHMLPQSPLRFLLADDAGAGKTIMTGLYIREMLSRQLVHRVLIVPPAGLVGNWHRELHNLFRLQFNIVSGANARAGNPFQGPEGDRVIVSVDTLAGDRMFSRLQDMAVAPYDLVVFDEAHKLSAQQGPDLRMRTTGRYRLAEALAGAPSSRKSRTLGWSAPNLLLLTATPHMGKDFPYYALWRLLLPDFLPTYDSFAQFPVERRKRHFIRRTKEEMVGYDGILLFPQRNCATLSYDLTQGDESEQALYDETTHYIQENYNRACLLNRTAARFAMSVFQRRLASSTYALMRSLKRRRDKLASLIDDIHHGRLAEEQLAAQQHELEGLVDLFEARTAEEDAAPDGIGEQHEGFEDNALAGTVASTLEDLELECSQVASLRNKARRLWQEGEDSKFEKLRAVLDNPDYANEKLIVFTEHRDTAHFLVRRLESLGYAGQIAWIHGSMSYQEREEQVAFFRRPLAEDGALYLVATDAAGEGINLQFCWLMVNYDIPWNPARLEQRMGRIHRYGQTHDPVIIVNLVAGKTREGRVLKTLLDKLETIRVQLRSDKVFNVVGRIFENLSIKDYLDQATTDEKTEEVVAHLEESLTVQKVRALEEKSQAVFGTTDVGREPDHLNEEAEQASLRRLLPGYVRRFLETAIPLLNLRIEGDLDTTFAFAPTQPRGLDFLLPALETYPVPTRTRATLHRPQHVKDAVWVRPGEPVFDRISAEILNRFGQDARHGAAFIDPRAERPYLYHLALISVAREDRQAARNTADEVVSNARGDKSGTPALETRLVGLRQAQSEDIDEWPTENLFLLRTVQDFVPSREPLAVQARRIVPAAERFAHDSIAVPLAWEWRQRLQDDLPARLESARRGFDFQAADLAATRARLGPAARAGDPEASQELDAVKVQQRNLTADRTQYLEELTAEPDRIQAGPVRFLAHALVMSARNPEEKIRYDADVEAIAMGMAMAYEEQHGADVKDVSRPELARGAGLSHWPGFDLLSHRAHGEWRAIEVKGRADTGGIELSENEWIRACNLRDRFWLYVVFDCIAPHPRLVRVRDPFALLLARSRELKAFTISARAVLDIAEPDEKADV